MFVGNIVYTRFLYIGTKIIIHINLGNLKFLINCSGIINADFTILSTK